MRQSKGFREYASSREGFTTPPLIVTQMTLLAVTLIDGVLLFELTLIGTLYVGNCALESCLIGSQVLH
jgi:hypothetical protein